MTQLDFYTFFRELLRQISFLYFPDRGCDPMSRYINLAQKADAVLMKLMSLMNFLLIHHKEPPYL